MNKQQLASLIWNTCDDLRGSISAVEYKDVILGLIFYRFVSEKEITELKKQDWTEEAMAEELNEEDAETIQWCKEHLGYFIAYENLFPTWMRNLEGSFSVADVTKALRQHRAIAALNRFHTHSGKSAGDNPCFLLAEAH